MNFSGLKIPTYVGMTLIRDSLGNLCKITALVGLLVYKAFFVVPSPYKPVYACFLLAKVADGRVKGGFL